MFWEVVKSFSFVTTSFFVSMFEKIKANKIINTMLNIINLFFSSSFIASSPKTKNSIRVLPLTKKLEIDLLELKNKAIEYTDYNNNWFVFGNSVCFPENTIQINKNKYCKLANIKQIRIHDFRHSCASLLINKGASISLVSKYLGHANVSITLNAYTHMYKSELTEMTKILDNL